VSRLQMRRRRVIASLTAAAAVGALVVIPFTAASAAPAPLIACTGPTWTEGPTYTAGTQVKYNGRGYRAIQTHTAHPGANWNPASTPSLWQDLGACDGGSQPPPTDPPPPNPGFVVSQAQFNQMFPNRNPFYTYSGLTTAMRAYPAFAKTGSDTVRKQEAAAFLANVSHETGGLVHITEINRGVYCDWSRPYGCPAGERNYYGRGPIQLSWNFNYYAAGNALGLPLLNDPWMVERDASVAWKTALWYWMTQSGPGTMTGHAAMVNGAGFGHTIRSINGSLECDGRNPAQVQSRVNNYTRFVGILGVPAGNNLYC
jgi:predicted chitinase